MWNDWRARNPDAYVDLREADLFSYFGEKTRTGECIPLPGLNLQGANLSNANLAKLRLDGADLRACYAEDADFEGARMNGANLAGAYMSNCDFTLAEPERADLRLTSLTHSSFHFASLQGANLRSATLLASTFFQCNFADAILAEADFEDCSLRESDLRRANLSGADLTGTSLVETDLSGANLDQCRIFGVSVWKTNLDETRQTNLIITPKGEPDLTADNLKVAQFIYLILNNQEVRAVIDTITSKVVLILGRFTPERKPTLDAIRTRLRECDYIPVMFDFAKPSTKTFIGTIKTLASMTRFVVADLTDARVVIQEIEAILREYPSVPVQPLILQGQAPPEVILDYTEFDTFLDIHVYEDKDQLVRGLQENVIKPAEDKIISIASRRSRLSSKLFGKR